MVQQTTARRKKSRSPSYPAIDLETAISRARQLYDHEQRHYAPIGAILQDWGYSPKSSGGMLTVAALKKYGLLEDQGTGEKREARLSPLALKIILDDRPDSAERSEAIREAALSPTIHSELWKEFDGSLPSDANLRFKLRGERGFTDSAANELIEEFRRTIAFASLDKTPAMSGIAGDAVRVPRTPATPRHSGDNNEGRLQAPQDQSRDSSLRAVPLPLSAATWVTIEAPFPLSEVEWERMMQLLIALKPGLTVPAAESSTIQETQPEPGDISITFEAQELLRKVDAGGVPAYITENLRRIAEENGISIGPDTTPELVIEALQQRALDSE